MSDKKAEYLQMFKGLPDDDQKALFEELEKACKKGGEGMNKSQTAGAGEQGGETVPREVLQKALDLAEGTVETLRKSQRGPSAAERLGNSTEVRATEELDASGFLRGITTASAEALDAMGARVEALQKSVTAAGQAAVAAGRLHAEVIGRLDNLLAALGQASPPRGATTLTGAKALQKSFAAGGGKEPLRKSEAMPKLEAAHRAMVDRNDPNAQAFANDIVKFDSTGVVTPALEAALRQ